MNFDNDLVVGKLRRWEKFLAAYRLPEWDAIPDFGLYMEQVVQLLKQYLDYLPPELKQAEPITAAAINNYVRTKLLPEPRKKRYYRIHIAYLIMICTLKQTLSIATLQRMIPNGLSEQEVHTIYNAYVERHRIAAEYFVQQVKLVAGPILKHDDAELELSVSETTDLIASAAIIGGFSRLLAEKLLLLEGRTLENYPAEALEIPKKKE